MESELVSGAPRVWSIRAGATISSVNARPEDMIIWLVADNTCLTVPGRALRRLFLGPGASRSDLARARVAPRPPFKRSGAGLMPVKARHREHKPSRARHLLNQAAAHFCPILIVSFASYTHAHHCTDRSDIATARSWHMHYYVTAAPQRVTAGSGQIIRRLPPIGTRSPQRRK